MSGKHDFRLSPQELTYLMQLVSHDESLMHLLRRDISPDRTSISLGRPQAEILRDFLTEQLAALGFDKDYTPTKNGRILEALIDRFYIP